MAKYIPGVCNIGPQEISKRQMTGVVGVIASVALALALLVVHASGYWALLLFFPATLSALGFLQASLHFCAGFGILGVFNVAKNAGNTDTVEQAEWRQKDQQKALQIILLSLIAGGIVSILAFFMFNQVPQPSLQPEIQPTPTTIPTSLPNDSPTPLTTPSPLPTSKPIPDTTSPVSRSYGPLQGKLACNYQVPATPGKYGTGEIDSNWLNAVTGTKGNARVNLCVSVNSNPYTLVSSDARTKGSRQDSVSWISLSTNYVFGLFDAHGGDAADCTGTEVAQCQIITQQFPTPSPTPRP